MEKVDESLRSLNVRRIPATPRFSNLHLFLRMPEGRHRFCAATKPTFQDANASCSSGAQSSRLPAYGMLSTLLYELNAIPIPARAQVRGELGAMERSTIGALVVIDVHARDVVAAMADARVGSENDFEWLSQLRYEMEEGAVVVKMINAAKDYGYEVG